VSIPPFLWYYTCDTKFKNDLAGILYYMVNKKGIAKPENNKCRAIPFSKIIRAIV